MGSKNNPGRFDCYGAALPDEPMFVLLARDHRAPALVEAWTDHAERNGADPAKVQEARQCAANMRSWRERNLPIPVAQCVCCDDTIQEDKAKAAGWHWGTTGGLGCNPAWLCGPCREIS